MAAKQKKNNSFLLQGIILASASIIVRLIGLVYRIPLTNIIGDEGNGFYSCAFEVYGIALLLSSLSLPLAVSKLVSARVIKGERRNAFRMFKGALFFALISGTIVAMIIYFGAPFIAKYAMTLELSAYALKVLAPGLIIVAVIGVIRGYFQGLGTMIPTAVSQVVEQIVNAIVSIVGASYLFSFGKKLAEKGGDELLAPAYGAAGGTLGTVVGSLSAFVFLAFILYAMRPMIKRQLKRDTGRHVESYQQIVTILVLTIIPIILSSAIYNVAQVLDQAMFNKIMKVQGSSVKEYSALWGMYSGKSSLLINVPISISNALGSSIIPSLVAACASGDKKQVHAKIHTAIRFTMLVAIPSFVGFVVLASPLLQLMFGDARKTPANMLALGAVTVVFYSLSTLMNAILQGMNDLKTPVKNAAISLIIHLLTLFIMLVMFKWSIYSVVISNIIFAVIMWYLNSRAVARLSGYRQELKKSFLIPGIASVVMGIAAYLMHWLCKAWAGGRAAALIALVVAVPVYAVCILLLGGISEAEMRRMPKGKLLVKLCKKLHLLRSNKGSNER